MADAATALTAIVEACRVELDAGPTLQAGQPVRATLIPPEGGLTITDSLAAPVDLAFLTKNVQWKDTALEQALGEPPPTPENLFDPNAADFPIFGPTPIAPVVNPVGGAIVFPPAALPGGPGVLGQVGGAIPLSVELPVALDATWTVLRRDGATLTELTEGQDFLAPEGLAGLAAAFAFAPPADVIELTTSARDEPAVTELVVRATVSASAADLTPVAADGTPAPPTATIEVPVTVQSLAVPPLLALFRHSFFAAEDGGKPGAALIVIPGDAQLRSLEQIEPVLGALVTQLEALTQLLPSSTPAVDFVAFLLGLRDLLAALAEHRASTEARVTVRVADSISNLRDVDLLPDGFIGPVRANNQLSSLILVGKETRRASFFNRPDFEARRGRLDVDVQTEQVAIVRNLHEPVEASPGLATPDPPDREWGDKITSLQLTFAS